MKRKRVYLFLQVKNQDSVTVNPESMIADKGFATGGYLTKDKLAIGESGTELILSNKTIKELREYAEELGIEIPADVKRKKTSLNYYHEVL